MRRRRAYGRGGRDPACLADRLDGAAVRGRLGVLRRRVDRRPVGLGVGDGARRGLLHRLTVLHDGRGDAVRAGGTGPASVTDPARRHGLLQLVHAALVAAGRARRPARVDAGCLRLGLLPRVERDGLCAGRARGDARLVDRRAQPARLGRLRRLRGRVPGRALDHATGQRGHLEHRHRDRRALLPRRRAASALGRLGRPDDLLHGPAVAVRILEEHEPAPRELLDLARLHAVLDELRPRGVRVVDDDLQALDAARLHAVCAGGERDRARRARRRELDEAQLLVDSMVVVGVEADLVDIERLRPVHVGHRHRNQLELHLNYLALHPVVSYLESILATKRMSGKDELIDELIAAFRDSGNQDDAIDNLAAKRLGVNRTDLLALNAIENAGGLSAGELAVAAGLTTGAVTGVIDRLERAGYARRVADPTDRRRVKLEVTPEFYARAAEIWAPMAADWRTVLSGFTRTDLERLLEVLRATTEVGKRHLERLSEE